MLLAHPGVAIEEAAFLPGGIPNADQEIPAGLRGMVGPERWQNFAVAQVSRIYGTAAGEYSDVQSFEEAKALLRVQVMPPGFGAQHPEMARRRFSDTLDVVYVLDEPDRYGYVTRAMIEGWGVAPADVEAVAVANLFSASKEAPFDIGYEDDEPALAVAGPGDDYEAARLLLPTYLNAMRRALKAESIDVVAPTRGTLMAWPTDSRARREFAAQARREMRADPFGRSDELFRFDRGGLRPMTVAELKEYGR